MFADDPEKMPRSEDKLLSYSLNMFLRAKPEPNPELYLIYPMAKATLQATKAIREYAISKDMVDEDVGFLIVGASKRGQLTWQVGVADRPDLYPPILGIMPCVPIVPALPRDMHRMWRSYGGFTFAMHDFINIGLIDILDDKATVNGMAQVDPFYFPKELSKIPVMAVVSSGDEFMMMDWTQIWDDELGMFKRFGEMHLFIVPNDEHGLIMNVVPVLSNGIAFARSLALGETAE